MKKKSIAPTSDERLKKLIRHRLKKYGPDTLLQDINRRWADIRLRIDLLSEYKLTTNKRGGNKS
jgi:hypothetical protein